MGVALGYFGVLKLFDGVFVDGFSYSGCHGNEQVHLYPFCLSVWTREVIFGLFASCDYFWDTYHGNM